MGYAGLQISVQGRKGLAGLEDKSHELRTSGSPHHSFVTVLAKPISKPPCAADSPNPATET